MLEIDGPERRLSFVRLTLHNSLAEGASCRADPAFIRENLFPQSRVSSASWADPFCLVLLPPWSGQSKQINLVGSPYPRHRLWESCLGRRCPPNTTGNPWAISAARSSTRTETSFSSARVRLARAGQADQEVVSDRNGRFLFAGVPVGPFQVTILAEGFATQARFRSIASR